MEVNNALGRRKVQCTYFHVKVLERLLLIETS